MSKDAECPECAATIKIPSGTLLGEIMPCPDCGIELEVSQLDPPVLQPAPEEEEDWGE